MHSSEDIQPNIGIIDSITAASIAAPMPHAVPMALANGRSMPARGLKVLFVTNMYPDDRNPGSGAFVRQQAEQLRKAGHQIDILHIQANGARLKYLTSGFKVFSRTRAMSYDIVHAHYGLSGFPALFRYRTPLVVTLHGSDALVGYIQPWISKAVCSFADAVIVVSKNISARIGGEVIPCGIDLEMFKPRDRVEARLRLGLPLQANLVLFPFDPRREIKRYDLAQASVRALGDPKTQLIAVNGKRNEDMPWYYSAADVMVLCSRSEGSPTSVKEALACNLPVVSTDVGDVREIMNGIEGCVICADNAESLARGIERVLNRPDGPPFCGQRSMERYDQSRVVTEIVRVYRSILRDRPHGHRSPGSPPSPKN
ncbi:MAG TPA: glycosyltransferase [Candidatus Sulfotelmatobacter sp.]|jgi:glycosyltransferase involved in cell wall biosynthesis